MGTISGGDSSTSLAPGFRFHPTDEELVFYYLRRKVCGKPFRFDAITDIDVYKTEPWDLPGLSKLKSRDLEWYFFSNLGNKYGNGSRTNRATSEGYWKTTGKDRPVHHRSKVVGMKKTLVYHHGRAPRGERSNWVMHEYKLVGEGLEKEPFVLCRIFHKSGSGPKNGEKYGAPFVEEEWEEDECEVTMPPVSEVIVPDVSEEYYFNKKHAVEFPLDHSIPPLNFFQGESRNFAQTLAENELNSLNGVNEEQIGQETNDHKLFNRPVQLEPQAVNNEFVVQPTNITSQTHLTYKQLGEQCLENVNTAPSDEGFYLEANDLLEPIEENSSDFQLLDEYLGYFDANTDFGEYLSFDSSDMLDVDGMASGQAFLTDQIPPESTQQISDAYKSESVSSTVQVMLAQSPSPGNDIGQYSSFDSSDFLDDSIQYDPAFLTDQKLDQSLNEPSAFYELLPEAYSALNASPSEQLTVAQNFKRDSKYSFMKQASQMLGNFPAGPAFASEFPTEDMAAKLHSAMQPTESVRVAAARDNGMCLSLDKCGNFNVVLSFHLPEGITNPVGVEALTGMLARRMTSITSRGWFYFLFFSVLVFCISSKVDNCIYAR